ncbi:beta-galactosidase trimerization domain-containing protein [Cohnella yongneupensis]|uniref:Beta-galactosidase trimerization domain-containing protein n=1 Tax=Cohnella yongneupensis TaxID=425006 RepID=A0ABW0R5C4_9BACL
MRYRQVHLDFHTSEAIPDIGSQFSKKQFQDMLKLGHVDSITVFSKCHHGWAYHPSETNEMHPGLSFDLLGAQIEAAHEIGVNTPVYISAGLDEKLARRHSEWLIRNSDDRTNWVAGFMHPGYHQFCMNTPYLDILVAQIEEVVQRYDADGIFLDIVGWRECYCQQCVASIRSQGQDPRDLEAMRNLWENTWAEYARRTNEAVHKHKPGLPVFHNQGHLRHGRRDWANFNTHLELESLPTGGWGYDHFPLSARYAETIGIPYLGMTGKFHTMWGEFGGFKHPNALRYEAALSLANGARLSIGDQLHPDGRMDEATYALIGEAYREVEAKEPWVEGSIGVAEVALLSLEALGREGGTDEDRTGTSNVGAARILLEGKFLFDVIDTEADFSAYRVIILPDLATLHESLNMKLEAYVHAGGKLLATGLSGMDADHVFPFELGAKWKGASPFQPDYFQPRFKPGRLNPSAFIMYSEGQIIELAEGGIEHGHREAPYFNRDVFTFCSHQHTPNRKESAGPGMTEGKHGIYVAWNLFKDYATKGSLIAKEMVLFALNRLLPDKLLQTNLPAQGIVTLRKQPNSNRWVNHLLYVSPVRRGGNIEIIEDIVPLHGIEVSVRVPRKVKRVYMAPQMTEIPFEQKADPAHQTGTSTAQIVSYRIPKLENHEMAVLEFISQDGYKN